MTQEQWLEHISNQLDLIHHSIYVSNLYMTTLVVCSMLLSLLAMFMVGFQLTKGK